MKLYDLKRSFYIKQLGIEHIEQFNELLRYAFQVSQSDLMKFGWDNEQMKESKMPILQHACVLGYFDKDKLISQIALYPMEMNIYNRIYKMGGITGVATYPEYSGIGLMADLMREILHIMRQKGQSISCLYPYSIAYYRRRGWEIISDKMMFELKDFQVPKTPRVHGMIQRVQADDPALISLHDEFARQTHGCLIRDDLAWSEYWRWDVDDEAIAIYYDERGRASGYIVYLLYEDVFKIKEMIYLNEEARAGLWQFVNAHQSMFDKVVGANYTNNNLAFLLEDGHIVEKIRPFIMARIVDVEQFLLQFCFEKTKSKIVLCLEVSDPLLEWNNGAFLLCLYTNKVQVKILHARATSSPFSLNPKQRKDIQAMCKATHGVECKFIRLDIQTLTTMLLGYKRPLYLRKINRLHASNEGIDVLEEILPEGKAYFSDYF